MPKRWWKWSEYKAQKLADEQGSGELNLQSHFTYYCSQGVLLAHLPLQNLPSPKVEQSYASLLVKEKNIFILDKKNTELKRKGRRSRWIRLCDRGSNTCPALIFPRQSWSRIRGSCSVRWNVAPNLRPSHRQRICGLELATGAWNFVEKTFTFSNQPMVQRGPWCTMNAFDLFMPWTLDCKIFQCEKDKILILCPFCKNGRRFLLQKPPSHTRSNEKF